MSHISNNVASALLSGNVQHSGRHWIGKKGGGNTEAQQKRCCTIPCFLEITDYEKAFLYVAFNSFSPKVYSTNRPNRHTFENVLAIHNTFESVLLWQNILQFICWACACSRKILVCFGIRPTIVITSVPYIPYCYANNSKYLLKMTSTLISCTLCHCHIAPGLGGIPVLRVEAERCC